MTNRVKYISITIIIFLALIFMVSANYYRISGIINNVTELLASKIPFFQSKQLDPASAIVTEKQAKLKKGIPLIQKTFYDLPNDFIHLGSFLFFKASKETTIDEITRSIITYTSSYRRAQLKRLILTHNKINDSKIAVGQVLVIPTQLPSMKPDPANVEMPKLMSARGLYLTGTSAANPALLERIPHLKKMGINSVVFDVKDVDGILNYKSSTPLALKYDLHEKACIDNIDLFIKSLKEEGIYVIARISAFRDIQLVKKEPSFAIKSKNTGKTWKGGGEVWCDPTNKTVQDYVIDLAIEIISKGADEIQFDYIRFPTGGDQRDTLFSHQSGNKNRDHTISDFLKLAHSKISATNARLSIDIFGVVAWGKAVDINSTGQRIELLSPYCDYISPMLYPSHFNNDFDGFKNPADHPYYFINEGNKKVISLATTANPSIIIRPWLQAFRWKVSSYGPQYIIKQVQASDESGAKGYLFWNASNDYKHVLSAMESLSKSGKIQ